MTLDEISKNRIGPTEAISFALKKAGFKSKDEVVANLNTIRKIMSINGIGPNCAVDLKLFIEQNGGHVEMQDIPQIDDIISELRTGTPKVWYDYRYQIADWLDELRDRREEERRLETVAIDRGYTP